MTRVSDELLRIVERMESNAAFSRGLAEREMSNENRQLSLMAAECREGDVAELRPLVTPLDALEARVDDAYQQGYDDGCDDPDSVWTSTLMAKGKFTEALCFILAARIARATTETTAATEGETE